MSNFIIKNDNRNITEEEKLYGLEPKTITIEDIEALLEGKMLYGNINWEYAFTIKLDKDLYKLYKEKLEKMLEILGADE